MVTTAHGLLTRVLVPIAKEIFDQHMPEENQLHRLLENIYHCCFLIYWRLQRETTPSPAFGTIFVLHCSTWLTGSMGAGCVPLYNLMEDAATAEISRAQIWQWLHHSVVLDDGSPLTRERFLAVVEEEMPTVVAELSLGESQSVILKQARELFEVVCLTDPMISFLTLPAYEVVLGARRFGEGGKSMSQRDQETKRLREQWKSEERWRGIKRPYRAEDVVRLRGSVQVEYTIARLGAGKALATAS